MSEIIKVDKLTKKYGNLTAVDNISFTVEDGETFGILGPNGAGKTTTLEIIEGLKAITSGGVTLDGHDVQRETRKVKSLIGVQLQKSDFFEHLKLTELLDVFASLYGRRVNAKEILNKVELTDKIKSEVKQLSGGQKQRFSIAAALVNDPKVLFLDEPTTGLDPQARRHLWDLVESINRQGKTIILTTHYMEEAEVLCDRVAIMDNAKIIALDTTLNLLANSGIGSTLTFNTKKPCPLEHFRSLPGVIEASDEDHSIRLLSKRPDITIPALYTHGEKCAAEIINLQLRQATMEDVFLKLTGRSLRE
ncbi:MAG: ABC transporter ATP-binding protein [Patescibacteria group bacterium]